MVCDHGETGVQVVGLCNEVVLFIILFSFRVKVPELV